MDDDARAGGWQAPPRGPADEETLQAAVRAAVEAEVADLRAAVDAGLRDLAARADEILGGGLGDLAIRFGEQLKTLQTAAATTHDDRRIDAQTANRVRAMEDRLDHLIARIESDAPVASATPAQVDSEQIRRFEESQAAGFMELEGSLESVALAERLEELGESLVSRLAQLSGRFDDVVERVDVIEQLFEMIVEGDPEREEQQRRLLVAELARATSGHVCEECGFVAETAGGLASHARVHEDGKAGR